MQYPRKKKPRKISDAVFRGQKSAYSFQVFPINAEMADGPAVFIIARRRTDKFGNGHQSAVCIGETSSILSEMKRHRRAKCVKNNDPNVICLLEEENAAARAGVLQDLTAARKFGCIQNVYDSTIKPKSYEPIKLSGRRRRVVPETPADTTSSPARNVAADKPAKKVVASARAAAKTGAKAVPAPAKGIKTKPAKRVATVAPKRKPGKSVAAAKRKNAKPVAAKKPISKAAPSKQAKASRGAAASASKRVAALKPAAAAAGAAKKRTASKPGTIQPKVAAKPAEARRKASPAKRVKAATSKKPVAAKTKQRVESAAAAKRPATAGTRSRVQSSLDSNGRQHRLSKPEKPVGKRAKGRVDGKSRSRQKAAA